MNGMSFCQLSAIKIAKGELGVSISGHSCYGYMLSIITIALLADCDPWCHHTCRGLSPQEIASVTEQLVSRFREQGASESFQLMMSPASAAPQLSSSLPGAQQSSTFVPMSRLVRHQHTTAVPSNHEDHLGADRLLCGGSSSLIEHSAPGEQLTRRAARLGLQGLKRTIARIILAMLAAAHLPTRH